MTIRLFRESGAAPMTGGGPTLDTIFNPGDGTQKQPDLAAAQAEADKAAAEKAAADKVVADKAEAERIAADKAAGEKQPVEGLNEDGSLQEGYIKNADGTVAADPNYKAPELTSEEEAAKFYETVEKLTGIPVKVEYPQDVDPISAEGVAIREQALLAKGSTDLENYIATTKPRAYAFMLHLDNGGTEADFFNDPVKAYALPELAALEGSADIQAAVYKHSLIARGNDPEDADALVAGAIKANKLLEKAKASYTEIDTAQKQQIADLQKRQQQDEAAMQAEVGKMSASLKSAIATQISYTVPVTEQPAFQKFVEDSLQYDAASKKFVLVQELTEENKKVVLESLLLQYKKGNLDNLVKKQAGTLVTQRLRTAAGKTKDQKSSTGANGNSDGKPTPLVSIF